MQVDLFLDFGCPKMSMKAKAAKAIEEADQKSKQQSQQPLLGSSDNDETANKQKTTQFSVIGVSKSSQNGLFMARNMKKLFSNYHLTSFTIPFTFLCSSLNLK